MAQVGRQLQAAVEDAVAALGYELVGVEYIAQGRHSVLRVYIDSEHGITVDDCARVSHQVSGALDVDDPIKGPYTLEVSSPGLDRPLFKPEHFERFAGEQVQIRLAVPLDGRRKFKGVLRGLRDGRVVVDMDGQELLLEFENVDKANLVHEW